MQTTHKTTYSRPRSAPARDAILERTLGLMRRRRFLKRCGIAAGLLGCYLAGIATIAIARSGGNERSGAARQDAMIAAQPAHVAPTPGKAEAVAATPPRVAPEKLSAFERWRRSGDRCLRESDDIASAVKCYSRALKLASEKDLAILPSEDNWLWMALKNARLKERRHAISEPS
jgi:hypothetical protein